MLFFGAARARATGAPRWSCRAGGVQDVGKGILSLGKGIFSESIPLMWAVRCDGSAHCGERVRSGTLMLVMELLP